jgi:hypothetical protein
MKYSQSSLTVAKQRFTTVHVSIPLGFRTFFGPCYQLLTPATDSSPRCTYSPGSDCTENVPSIIACSPVAGKTTCPQSYNPARVVILSPVYITVAWQWVCMSQYSSSEKLVVVQLFKKLSAFRGTVLTRTRH